MISLAAYNQKPEFDFESDGSTTTSPSLDDVSNIYKVHGSLMTVAWLLFASNGILTTRHGKDMFSNWTCSNGNLIWYGIHQVCMILTWCLCIFSVVIMFIQNGFDALKKEKITENPHSLIGIITTILLFFQPCITCFGLSRQSDFGSWLKLLHSFIDIACIILSCCAMLFATELEKANLDSPSKTVIYVFMGLLFACDQIILMAKKNNLISLAKTVYLAFIIVSIILTCIALLFMLL